MKTLRQIREDAGDPSRYPVKTQKDPAVKFWAGIAKRKSDRTVNQTKTYHGTPQKVPAPGAIADFVGIMAARAVGGKALVPDIPDTNFVTTVPVSSRTTTVKKAK